MERGVLRSRAERFGVVSSFLFGRRPPGVEVPEVDGRLPGARCVVDLLFGRGVVVPSVATCVRFLEVPRRGERDRSAGVVGADFPWR